MEDEIWKDIPGYEGLYKASNLGNIKRKKNLKTCISNKGYMLIGLSKKGVVKTYSVHSLIVLSFLGHVSNGYKYVCNHKNTNRLDNRINNLEIITVRENTNRKHLLHSSKYTGVSWNIKTKKWVAIIGINNKNKYLGYFENELDASKAYENELIKINNY